MTGPAGIDGRRSGARAAWDPLGEALAGAFARAADASLSRDGGPLRRDGRWVRLLPFALIALVATVLTLLPTGTIDAEGEHLEAAIAAAIVFMIIAAAAALLPWDRLPANAQALVPFGYMVVVVLVRHAQGSGDAGYTVLFMLPVVWLALYAPTWQLVVALPVVAALILLPPVLDGLILGENHYPSDDIPLEVIITLIVMFVAAAIRFATNAASVDSLTGLPNRRVFMARLRRVTAESAASGHPFSVAILDLDHFKQFNDSRGHDAGGRLLKATALEWQVNTRGKDVLARIGGEEFGLIVEGGAAECLPGHDGEEALRPADEALYAAKEAGRARVMQAAA